MQKIELLCPAQNLEFGKAAINYGADAVYIGAGKFGARASAGNSLEDIEELVRYAHLYNASVYVTFNTIIFEKELKEASELIRKIVETGIDALIIQDMGILEMDIPPVRLFASTQTNNYSIDRIQFLESAGFERVILARELSLKQIKEIRSATKIDLESFIFGALCVSFSGQCYMSAEMTNRSANRGMCLQACRLPYYLLDANSNVLKKNKHLLSLKDLDASAYIKELLDAGVSSFKIEGRLKNKAYVINNTAYFRGLIDNLLNENTDFKKSSSGYTNINFEPDPQKTFNRGFSDYFFDKRKTGLISPETPKSLGKFIGTVKANKNNRILVDTYIKLNNGDGICYIDSNNELNGFQVNDFAQGSILPSSKMEVPAGTKLYRNMDLKFTQLLENDNNKRRVDAKISCFETENGFILKAVDEDNIGVSVEFSLEKEYAKDEIRAKNTIIQQLGKSGDSIFNISEIELGQGFSLFLPISVINNSRREVLEKLTAKRLESFQARKKIKTNSKPKSKSILDYSYNVSNSLAENFYKKHGSNVVESAFEITESNNLNDKVLMTTKYCVKFELGFCEKFQTGGKKINEEPLFLQQGKRKYVLDFDCGNCLMKIRQAD